MAWSVTLFRIFGSEIRIHLTFLLLLAWIGISAYNVAGWQAALDSILFILAIFGCVALHELGHAVAARRYGIETPDITLLPIGGLARLSRMPEKPSEEVVIAIAGPLVNVVIAGLLILFGANIWLDPAEITGYGQGFISQLALVNLILVGFNLIPAFPMDGGRVLRALLAFRMSRRRATEIAARIGQALAFVFAFIGLIYGNVFLIFIAVFVYIAAASEAGHTGLMDVASRLTADRAMIRVFESLSPQATLGDAADAILRTTQHEFPIVDGADRLRGVVTRSRIVAGLKASGRGAPVLESMVEVPTVGERAKLTVVVRHIVEQGAPIVGVTNSENVLVGYVSQENLSELVMLGESEPAAARGPWSRARRV